MGFRALDAPVEEEADAESAEETQHTDGVAVANAALVFLSGDVEAMMENVFDAPTGPIEFQPAGGWEVRGRCAGEQVDGFRLAGASVAVEQGDLRGGREANLLGGDGGAVQGAHFDPAPVAFACLRPGRAGGERAPTITRARRLWRGESARSGQ